MKLDKIRFARLISYLTEQDLRFGSRLTEVQIGSIDELVDVELPQPDVAYPSVSDVNELMRLMAAGDEPRTYRDGVPSSKINAIKLHRKLTGWGLKESKDQVEKYWKSAPFDGTLPVNPINQFVPPKAYGNN